MSALGSGESMGASSRVMPTGGGTPKDGAPDADPDPAREARLEALLRAWWCDERPAWTEESWWESTLHDDVRRLLWIAPGPRLAAVLSDLPVGQPCRLPHSDDRMLPDFPTPGHAPGWPCACQVVTAAAWEACAAWLSTRSAAALVAAAGPEPVEFDIGEGRQRIHDPAREELAHALRTSIPAMGNRIGAARALTSHPRLLQLVESAAISAWAGRLVLDHVADLEDQEASGVIEEVATRVHDRLATGRRPYHSAEVNRLARAARLRVCPETAQESRVRAFTTRRVSVHSTGNGMATLIADLADVDAHRIHRRLTAIAAGLQADACAHGTAEPRTRDQLRADIFTDLLVGGGHRAAGAHAPVGGHRPETTGDMAEGGTGKPTSSPTDEAPDQPPDPHRVLYVAGPARDDADASRGRPIEGLRPDIQVIVSLPTLIGLADDPAEVPGLGPIPADIARALAADGSWRAWIADAAGTVTATGARGYVPSAPLARLVRAREPHCRFPGCRQPAARCDLDHAVPWPAGATTAANLGPLCRRHHNLKTHTPWTLDPLPEPVEADGPSAGWRWRTPAGFTITDSPEPPLGPTRSRHAPTTHERTDDALPNVHPAPDPRGPGQGPPSPGSGAHHRRWNQSVTTAPSSDPPASTNQ